MDDDHLAPFLRLGAAVIRQALKDLRGANGVAREAAAWLWSNQAGPGWAGVSMAGLAAEVIGRWDQLYFNN